MQNSLKLKKRSGFTLIELLVVVAILGILASVGILSYSGYVQGAKRKSVENLLMQMSLGQSEYYADNNVYHTSHNCSSAGSAVATAKDTTTNALETSLLGGQEIGKDFRKMAHSISRDLDAKDNRVVAKCLKAYNNYFALLKQMNKVLK